LIFPVADNIGNSIYNRNKPKCRISTC